MPVDTQAIGKTYEPALYAVGREKVREYARAVGETEPLYLDVRRRARPGYADLVAPPMFAVVYCAPALGPAMSIRSRYRLRDAGPRRAGVRVGAAGRRRRRNHDDRERQGHQRARGTRYYVFESVSANQQAEEVCRGTWTKIVRGV